jgi:hypothetical protein
MVHMHTRGSGVRELVACKYEVSGHGHEHNMCLLRAEIYASRTRTVPQHVHHSRRNGKARTCIRQKEITE